MAICVDASAAAGQIRTVSIATVAVVALAFAIVNTDEQTD